MRPQAVAPLRGAVLAACLAVALVLPTAAGANTLAGSASARVDAHDNTRAAGTADGNTVTIRLRASRGEWRPEGTEGPPLTVEACGEEGKTLTVPAPLLRVTEGAIVDLSVRNELASPLRVHGLCSRDGSPCPPVDVAPGCTTQVRFPAGRPGTYHYWATSLGAPSPMREMAGAFVVDPKEGPEPDRIFVITEWNTLTAPEFAEVLAADAPSERFLAARPAVAFMINGLSWPATERLVYRRGETVRWRVVNLSTQRHPMHLHGFYFDVLATGDGLRETPVADGAGHVVTHLLAPGGTMRLRWTPEQEGNWLFHCHIMSHVWPARRLSGGTTPLGAEPSHHAAHGGGAHDPGLGMAGMVLGITVLPAQETLPHARNDREASADRRLTMSIEPARAAHGAPAIGITFTPEGGASSGAGPRSPGPPLVLTRDEPVEITVVNRLAEPTSIHWHGLELESYYDGVHGWSGHGRRTAPMIEPGGSFVVRLTPPRAGTFIYHTHLHDYRQLASGLYGALIVTESRESGYDPELDHAIVLGRLNATEAMSIVQDPASIVINGERAPRWTWRAGTRHRIRLINITADDILAVSLVKGDGLLQWRPLSKDAVPVADSLPVPATAKVAVGETYDFEFEAPRGRGSFWIEVRGTNGKWQAQGQVLVR